MSSNHKQQALLGIKIVQIKMNRNNIFNLDTIKMRVNTYIFNTGLGY